MQWWFKTDAWIIGKLEVLCHFMQRTFGVKAMDLERLCLLLAIVVLAIALPTQFYVERHTAGHSWLIQLLLSELQAGMFLFRFVISFEIQRQRQELARYGIANSGKKPGHALVRLGLLCLCAVFVLLRIKGAGTYLWFDFYALAEYLDACDDLPPGESRVRQFVKALSAAMKKRHLASD